MVTKSQEELQALEKQKERMIHQYLALQDKADAVNEEIFHLCCEIETMNARITILQAEIKRAALAKGAPANGAQKHPPSNGTAY